MRNEAAIFLLSLQFLTRIPVPASNLYSAERLNASARYYPLIGFIVGALCAGLFWALSLSLPPYLALALSMAASLLITGAFHEDGLADTFDGIGGGHDRDQALTIMKDSRLGTYGTAALCMALFIKFASLVSLSSAWIVGALIVGHGLSRLSSVLVIATSTYARLDGKAKPVADGISPISLTVAAVISLVGLIASLVVFPLAALGLACAGLVIGHVAMRILIGRKLGGYTGDTLGAVQQVSEIGFYLGLVAWAS